MILCLCPLRQVRYGRLGLRLWEGEQALERLPGLLAFGLATRG